MDIITAAEAPEPEREPTWEEQVAEYRASRKSALKRTATVLSLPVTKAKAVIAAASH